MSTRDERATEERAAELAAKAELAQMVAAACTSSATPIDGKDAAKVVEHFAFFRGDLPDVPMQQLGVVPVGGGEEGESIKPFNILLDMRQLIEAITGGVIVVSGALVMPWLAVFAAHYIWCTLSRAATVELSEREAFVLWTLWVRRNPANDTSPNAEPAGPISMAAL